MHPTQAIAFALNRLTRQQAWAAQRLAQHSGKTVRIVVSRFELNWTIESDGSLVQADQAVSPDVTLEVLNEKLNPLAFFEQPGRPDIAEFVNVSGQAALAQVLSELARDLRPDPEDALAQWVGDIPARRIVSGVQQAARSMQNAGVGLAQNIAEYLSEETDMLVSGPALVSHHALQMRLLSTLDQVEKRGAKLQARVQQLERSMGAAR